MARVHTDTDVGVTIMFTGETRAGRFFAPKVQTGAEIENRKRHMLEDFEMLLRRHVQPHAEGDYSQMPVIRREFSCSACGSTWTEKSETYNGGCCEADEANNPEAISEQESAKCM